jgi:HTH-type transcriptional regulator/antitoxin HigA
MTILIQQQYKVEKMNIKPIKTETDYTEALQIAESLMGAKVDTPEGDKLDILITLIEAYEEKYYPISPPDPVEAIIHQMESQGLSRNDLIPLMGSRARVSEILNKKRSLSINMIRKLQENLGISAEILVKSYSLQVT